MTAPAAERRTMDAKVAALLRAPFPPEVVGKLPRVWCGACRDSREKHCGQHRKVRCQGCRNTITEAHLHLDYVGHAETTDRLLQADPQWAWEPFATAQDGLPLIDGYGGLWIRLTVAGVTRIGYGHAEGKRGPDAVKETIGDAIRNAAMRFGVALDLWGATFKDDAGVEPEEPPPGPAETVADAPTPAGVRDWALQPDRTAVEVRDLHRRLTDQHPDVAAARVVNEHGDDEQLSALLDRRAHDLDPADTSAAAAGEPEASDDQHRQMHGLWRDLGYGGDANRTNRLAVTTKLVGREVTSSKQLTYREAITVINALRDRKRQQGKGAAA